MSDNKERVNHPSHYVMGQIEVIKIIEDQGKEFLRGFCIGNVLKYALRSPYKAEESEDIRKAIWYLEYWTKYLESNPK